MNQLSPTQVNNLDDLLPSGRKFPLFVYTTGWSWTMQETAGIDREFEYGNLGTLGSQHPSTINESIISYIWPGLIPSFRNGLNYRVDYFFTISASF